MNLNKAQKQQQRISNIVENKQWYLDRGINFELLVSKEKELLTKLNTNFNQFMEGEK